MISGLLWYDDDPRKDSGRKIGEAAERYLRRFGVAPTVCHVHCPPQAAGSADPAADAGTMRPAHSLPPLMPVPSSPAPLTVVPDRRVRPHHFWLGQTETETARTSAGDTARTARG